MTLSSKIHACAFFSSAVLLLAALALPLEAQEQPKPPEAKEEVAVRSLAEERRDTIKYGLESELIELVAALKSENNSGFVDDFAAILATGPGVKTVQEIFSYLGAMKSDKGVRSAEKYIDNAEEESREILIAALRYLAEEKTHNFPEKIYPLLKPFNPQLAGAAVRYFGKKGGAGSAEQLIEFFKK